ncbi:MAG: hypothetical protein KKD05_05285 [Candidatus Omnitrophica bacterium]|nr:hypothetical protein [Candidatus Omnitrophota bacterium]
MESAKFTFKAQEVLELAAQTARGFKNQEIDISHLILAMLSIDQSIAVTILEKIGVDISISFKHNERN